MSGTVVSSMSGQIGTILTGIATIITSIAGLVVAIKLGVFLEKLPNLLKGE